MRAARGARSLLDGARLSWFIDHHPAREVKRPSMRETISPVSRAFTVEQINILLDLVPEGAHDGHLAALSTEEGLWA